MDRLDLIIENKFIENKFKSSNQQIPGKLGNNINGVTNLDLTGEEELVLSDDYADAWDDSLDEICDNVLDDLIEYKELNYTDDEIIESLVESYSVDTLDLLFEDAASVNNKYDNKANKINRKFNRNKAKLQQKRKIADHKNVKTAARRDYHKDMANNTSGIRKAYHNWRAKANDKKVGKFARKIEKNQEKRNKALAKNQEKRAKKLS